MIVRSCNQIYSCTGLQNNGQCTHAIYTTTAHNGFRNARLRITACLQSWSTSTSLLTKEMPALATSISERTLLSVGSVLRACLPPPPRNHSCRGSSQHVVSKFPKRCDEKTIVLLPRRSRSLSKRSCSAVGSSDALGSSKSNNPTPGSVIKELMKVLDLYTIPGGFS